eukprot:3941719-Rhodomonas_salina.3
MGGAERERGEQARGRRASLKGAAGPGTNITVAGKTMCRGDLRPRARTDIARGACGTCHQWHVTVYDT